MRIGQGQRASGFPRIRVPIIGGTSIMDYDIFGSILGSPNYHVEFLKLPRLFVGPLSPWCDLSKQ